MMRKEIARRFARLEGMLLRRPMVDEKAETAARERWVDANAGAIACAIQGLWTDDPEPLAPDVKAVLLTTAAELRR